MNAEFVDTNIFVYAHDGGAGVKHQQSVALLRRIFEDGSGALSIQVLTEFYAAATRKLKMSAEEAEEVLRDLDVTNGDATCAERQLALSRATTRSRVHIYGRFREA